MQALSPDRLLVGYVLLAEWVDASGETLFHVTLDEREKGDWTPLFGMLRRASLLYENDYRRSADEPE